MRIAYYRGMTSHNINRMQPETRRAFVHSRPGRSARHSDLVVKYAIRSRQPPVVVL